MCRLKSFPKVLSLIRQVLSFQSFTHFWLYLSQVKPMTYLLIQKHSSSNPKQFVNLNWPRIDTNLRQQEQKLFVLYIKEVSICHRIPLRPRKVLTKYHSFTNKVFPWYVHLLILRIAIFQLLFNNILTIEYQSNKDNLKILVCFPQCTFSLGNQSVWQFSP